mgnify:CR=1 FL=1
MIKDRLLVNDYKTEFPVIRGREQLAKADINSFTVGSLIVRS